MRFFGLLLFIGILTTVSPCLAAPRKSALRADNATSDSTERLTRLRAGNRYS
jgi:hypothetical protein